MFDKDGKPLTPEMMAQRAADEEKTKDASV